VSPQAESAAAKDRRRSTKYAESRLKRSPDAKPQEPPPTPGELDEAEKLLQQLKNDEAAEKKNRGLTRAESLQMANDIRLLLLNATAPRMIVAGVVKKYGVTATTAQKALDVARREAMRTVGYYKVQIQEICQKNLVEILQDPDATRGERLAAIRQCDTMFDLRQRPEEQQEAEEEALQETMRRMEEMSWDELDRMKTDLFTGALDAKALYNPLTDVPRKGAKRRA